MRVWNGQGKKGIWWGWGGKKQMIKFGKKDGCAQMHIETCVKLYDPSIERENEGGRHSGRHAGRVDLAPIRSISASHSPRLARALTHSLPHSLPSSLPHSHEHTHCVPVWPLLFSSFLPILLPSPFLSLPHHARRKLAANSAGPVDQDQDNIPDHVHQSFLQKF